MERAHADLFPLDPPPVAPERWWTQWKGVLFGISFGVFSVLIARRANADESGLGMVWLLAGFLFGLWLQIIVHEAGHALAGRSAGMRLLAAGIGPWQWLREGDHWRLQRGTTVQGVGGFAAMLPGDPPPGRMGYAFFMSGGILANGLFSLALLAIARQIEWPWLLGMVVGIANVGLLMALLNLLPWRTATGWKTDGRKLLDLVQHPQRFHASLGVQQLAHLQISGIRPRDWPAMLVPPAQDVPDTDDADAALPWLVRMSWAHDRGDAAEWSRLAAHGPAVHRALPEGQRQGMAIAMASYAALHAQDTALLEAWRPLCDGSLLPATAALHWLDAEAAWLCHDRAAASALVDQARAQLPTMFDIAGRLQIEERLEALVQRIATASP